MKSTDTYIVGEQESLGDLSQARRLPGSPSPKSPKTTWPSSDNCCLAGPSQILKCWSPAMWTGSGRCAVSCGGSRANISLTLQGSGCITVLFKYSNIPLIIIVSSPVICFPLGNSEVLLRPRTTEEVSQILRYVKRNLPNIPFNHVTV